MPEYETQRNHHTSTLSIKNFPSVVGSLLWLNLQTRPDITQALNQLTRHVSDPCAGHITAVKHLLRFLNGTRNLGITYSNSGNSIPQIYSDATWASDIYTQRSVQAYVVLLYGAAVSWHCGTQKSISLSSTESEYFALSETVKEAVFIKHIMLQMKFASIKHWETEPMTIFEDNQAVIKIVLGDIKHKNQKHILVRLASVRDLFQSKAILPVYVPSADNVADVLTKNLAREPFARFQKSLLGLHTWIRNTNPPPSHSTNVSYYTSPQNNFLRQSRGDVKQSRRATKIVAKSQDKYTFIFIVTFIFICLSTWPLHLNGRVRRQRSLVDSSRLLPAAALISAATSRPEQQQAGLSTTASSSPCSARWWKRTCVCKTTSLFV